MNAALCFLGLIAITTTAKGDTEYYRHSIFDNSLTTDFYFYSRGSANGSSFLQLKDGRLPVETKTFFTPPNALRLEWQSQVNGGWEAAVHVDPYRNRFPALKGRNLYFWCFAPQAIAADDLPELVVSNKASGLQVAEFPGAFTQTMPLGKFAGDIPAERWIRVRIPFSALHSASIYEFRPQDLHSVIFHQGRADGGQHVLIIDEIRTDDDPPKSASSSLSAPTNVRATGYDRHVELSWDPVKSAALGRYVISRSLDGKNFEQVGIQLPGVTRYSDFLGKAAVTAQYKVAASDSNYHTSPFSQPVSASTRE